MPNTSEEIWMGETIKGYLRMSYKINKVLFDQQSPFQRVEIVETEGFGRMLLNDRVGMMSERDEFIYHEMIVHVPLFTHPNPRQVLVIGGGDGGAVREILRHPSVKKVTLVEIDQVVIDACKAYVPSVAKAMDDPRCEVRVEDGAKFVAETKEKFDVVIIDSTDPMGPSVPLFGVDFYKNVSRILTDDGLCVSQAESPYYFEEAQTNLLKTKKSVFPRVHLYRYANLVYPGGMWGLSMGSKKLSPLDPQVLERSKKRAFTTDYYSTPMHQASFVLPPFLEHRLEAYITKI